MNIKVPIFSKDDESMMVPLSEKLEKIRLIRKEKLAPVEDIYNDGLTRNEIVEMTKSLPFSLPAEIYALYEWRNGISEESERTSFFRGLRFLPLEDALENYKTILNELEPSYSRYEDPLFTMQLSFPFAANLKESYSILFFPSNEHPLVSGYKPVIRYYEGAEVLFWSFDEMLDAVMVEWYKNLFNN